MRIVLKQITYLINSIKDEFENAKMNEQKKLIIFELLFLHLDVLVLFRFI
jgi:predicted metallopeptidase